MKRNRFKKFLKRVFENQEEIEKKPTKKHNFKIVGFIFGGFSVNPYKVLQCRDCKKYSCRQIPEEEMARTGCKKIKK